MHTGDHDLFHSRFVMGRAFRRGSAGRDSKSAAVESGADVPERYDPLIGRWAPAALVAGTLPALASAFVAPFFGAPGFDPNTSGQVLAEQGGLAVGSLVYLVTGPLSEEFGWRGFVQPRLRRRLSPLMTSLVLGTVWALWHLPFFAMTGTWQATLGTLEIILYLASVVPISLGYWLISERLRGGVPAAVLSHWIGNMALATLPLTAPVSFGVYLAMWCILAAAVSILMRPDTSIGHANVTVRPTLEL